MVLETTTRVVAGREIPPADTWRIDPAERIGFLASTEINRGDFDITWNQALAAGGFVLGKGIRIELDVEAVRPPSE